MTVYTYSRIPALNPNTSPMSVAKSASGSVYDINDTGFLTPLNMTLVATNAVVTTIASDANGIFPDFTLLDRTSCVFKAASGLPFVLTTTTPVPGPAGGAGPTGAQGPAGIADDNSVAQQVTNGTATKAALSATYVPKWKPNTAYLAGDPVLSPAGDVVTALANFTSGPSYNPVNWTFSAAYAPATGSANYVSKGDAATSFPLVHSVNASLANGTDVTSALQSAIDTAATFGAGLYIPEGTYKVTAPLENFHKVRLEGVITAGAPGMAAVVRTRLTTRFDGGSITGKGTIDANTNAAVGIHLRNFLYFDIAGISVNGGNVAAIKTGDSGSSGRSAEAVISKVRIINNGSVVAASRGILSENSGDHSFSQIIIMNYEYGVTLPAANNAMMEDIHVWCDPSKGATITCFENYSNNTHYDKCHADSPTQYGFREYGYQSTFSQCGTYNNPSASTATDNVVVGVKFEAANPIATLVGHFFFGGNGSKRLKSDIEAADGNYGLIQTFGCSNQYVVNIRTIYNRSIGQIVRDAVTAGKGFIADAPAPANDIGLIIRTGGLDRWKWVTDGAAETGSNAGTGLALRSFTDAGALLAELLFFSRSSGTCVWKTNQSINDGFNITLGTTTGTKFGTAATQKMGFYGLGPVAQQSVTGARGSAAATASLNAKLATLGLIADLTVSPVSTKTSSYTITATDRYVISNNGTLTMTLPDPTLASVGYPVTIKNVNASNCTVASLASGLIDGAATVTLAQWAKVTVISDGTQWLTV